METTEIWKPVKGYEGKYEVSDLGNVRSLSWHRTGRVVVMTPCLDPRGYYRVKFGRSTKKVHRLVAEAFIQNPENKPCINHKDENPKNNRADNLEWCTYEYNNNYGSHYSRVSKSVSKTLRKPVYKYTIDGEFVDSYPGAIDTEADGFSRKMIHKCCAGINKSHKGFKWSHKPPQP